MAGKYVPEAIEPIWFDAPGRSESAIVSRRTVGSIFRGSVKSIVEQSVARLHRFRDDVDWQLFGSAPAPEEMALLDAWIDPATLDDDFDGLVAEAAAAGVPIVAARTPINTQRLEKGRTGLLVPVDDPNEMTHAILAALFKPELIRPRLDASRQTIGKYRPVHRWRALSGIYQSNVHDRSS
jgi:glycosyltransferase involved in cell wall biosynthesis